MELPSRRDIVPIEGDLDAEWACRNFLGKSLEEAEGFVRHNSPSSAEDFMWMGPVAFRFYVDAAINYVKSEHATGDSDFIAFLATTLEHRLRGDEPTNLLPAASKLAEACRYVLGAWAKFSEGAEAYGDVRARYVELEREFSKLSNSSTSV